MRTIDYAALAILLGQFFIYQYLYEYNSDKKFGKTRESIIGLYRWRWLNNILDTNNHILGIQTIRNLEMVHTFLITLTMFMMGGITSIFSLNPHWIEDISDGNYLFFLSKHTVAIKLLVAMMFLMMAMFNFIFGLRVCFNMNFTVAGANRESPKSIKLFINNQIKRQARHFITGVRALYYTMFPLIWIIDVWVMILISSFTFYIFFRFDYSSVPDTSELDGEMPDPE